MSLLDSGTTAFINHLTNRYFGIYNAGGTQSVRIQSTGDSWLNGGNVGINTSSPTEKLEVTGKVKASHFLAGNGLVGTPSYSFSNEQNTGFYKGLPNRFAAAVDGRYLAEFDGTGGSNKHILYGKDNTIGDGNLTIVKDEAIDQTKATFW
jgi:hypothetical protein